MELKTISAKTINGIVERTHNALEMSPNGKIPGLWQKFDELVPVDYQHGERVYGVYYDYESDHTGEFNVLAGFDGANLPTNVSLTKIDIPSGKYLVFSQQGEMPQIAIDAWTEVWQYFTTGEAKHQRLHTIDFEYYPNGNSIEVYIAVE
ncbi:AraC family transcriptional regulator [Thalassotalea sp. M1531]|uniref:AraC family transcriptional regulator n=1 Tax=Thalassotalea algicola TaxID=2716224 RepID=A0A7Y0LF31_9GAMM|nr:effector binding domain-containing protein [Thalassotalea algicola]NMP31990.1 AraC family transcriptional regulator [Thalassotalea algicola]